jgi:hypothetical protein
MDGIIRVAIVILLVFGASSTGHGATVYASQPLFRSAITGDYTLVNLDAPPLAGFTAPYRVEDTNPAAEFLALGIDFVGVNARILAGQDAQIPTPGRDRLIANGRNFDGEVVVNFTDPVNAVGVFSNSGDGGQIFAYSGAGLSGELVGIAQFGSGGFGGLVATGTISSALFTCEFNADLRCGLYDIQFGTLALVPLPAPLGLVAAGLAMLGFAGRNRGLRKSGKVQ